MLQLIVVRGRNGRRRVSPTQRVQRLNVVSLRMSRRMLGVFERSIALSPTPRYGFLLIRSDLRLCSFRVYLSECYIDVIYAKFNTEKSEHPLEDVAIGRVQWVRSAAGFVPWGIVFAHGILSSRGR